MLPARHRLRRSADFTVAVRQGKRAGRAGLVVHLAPGAPTRVGFIVGKAVGGAVVRNLVKRRLRHLVAERLDRLPTESTVVVRALAPAAGLTYAQFGQELDAALRRVTPRDR